MHTMLAIKIISILVISYLIMNRILKRMDDGVWWDWRSEFWNKNRKRPK